MTSAALSLVVDHVLPEKQPTWTAPPVALPVRSQQDYVTLAETRGVLKTFIKQAKAWFAPMKEAADKAHKAVCLREREVLAPAEVDDRAWGSALETWDREQAALRQKEERRLAEIARKAEEQRRLEEAAALEAEALATDDMEMLATAQEIISAPVETPVVIVQAPPKVAGLSYKDNWVAVAIDLKALVAAAAKDANLLVYLQPNESTINRIVGASKGALTIPGVKVENKRIPSQRGR